MASLFSRYYNRILLGVVARVLTRRSKTFAAETAASCILAFEPLWYKTERLRDPSRLGSELIAQTVV